MPQNWHSAELMIKKLITMPKFECPMKNVLTENRFCCYYFKAFKENVNKVLSLVFISINNLLLKVFKYLFAVLSLKYPKYLWIKTLNIRLYYSIKFFNKWSWQMIIDFRFLLLIKRLLLKLSFTVVYLFNFMHKNPKIIRIDYYIFNDRFQVFVIFTDWR